MLGKRKRVVPYGAGAKKTKRSYSKVPKARMALLKRPSTIVPSKTTRAVLKYMDAPLALNPGLAGAAASYVYCLNGLYDPNVTGVGHQPAGFDEYMTLYEEYVVLGCTITVRFINTDGTYPARVGISYSNESTTDTDCRVYVENGCTTWNVVNTAGSGSNIITLKHEIDVSKTSNQDIVNEENFAGNATQNPTEGRFFIMWVAPVDITVDMGPVYATAELTFDCLFRDNKRIALS